MKRTLGRVWLAGVALASAWAQDFAPIAPKTAPRDAGRPVPAAAVGGGAQTGDRPVAPVFSGLVLVSSEPEVKRDGCPGVTGVQVRDVPLLAQADAQRLAAPYLGKPLTESVLRRLQGELVRCCQRTHDRLLVDCYFPEQKVVEGVLQMVVVDGKVREISVTNPKGKFFSDRLVRRNLSLEPGQPVRESKLMRDLDWLNRNAYFREVNLQFKPAPAAAGAGLTDVDVAVKDRFPLRAFGGYENSGNKLIGEDRLLGGFNYGNLFGLDHQLNYQFTTATDPDRFRAHSGSYVAPLPWHHTLTLFGAYAEVTADLSPFGFAALRQRGSSYQASARYSVLLPSLGRLTHELSVGADLKRSDNNLEFNQVKVFATPTDLRQLTFGYDLAVPDGWGRSALGGAVFYSPGDATSDADYTAVRFGAKSQYLYAVVHGERATRLPGNFSWVLRGAVQFADANLLASEQFGLGGYATVRGYEERVANGDSGFILNNEIRTPPLRFGNLLPESYSWGKTPDGMDNALQFLAFFDYGYTKAHQPGPTEIRDNTLYSVGGGARYNFSKHITVRADFGYQLRDAKQLLVLDPGAGKWRVHLGAVMSF